MKKITMLAVIAVFALGLSGCIKMHSDTVIEKDGSGTANLTMSISPAAVELIKDMEALGMNEGQDMEVPMFDDIKKEDLEKAAKGHGVKITKFEKSDADGRQQVDVAMEFNDLKGLSYVLGNIMGGEAGDGMGIYETADGNYILKKALYDFPADPEETEEEVEIAPEPAEGGGDASTWTEEEKAQKQMEIMGKMMGAMAELDVRLTITVPGEVIESNAPVVEGNKSIWSVNAGNMMSQQGQDMDPVITFSSKGLKIKPIKE